MANRYPTVITSIQTGSTRDSHTENIIAKVAGFGKTRSVLNRQLRESESKLDEFKGGIAKSTKQGTKVLTNSQAALAAYAQGDELSEQYLDTITSQLLFCLTPEGETSIAAIQDQVLKPLARAAGFTGTGQGRTEAERNLKKVEKAEKAAQGRAVRVRIPGVGLVKGVQAIEKAKKHILAKASTYKGGPFFNLSSAEMVAQVQEGLEVSKGKTLLFIGFDNLPGSVDKFFKFKIKFKVSKAQGVFTIALEEKEIKQQDLIILEEATVTEISSSSQEAIADIINQSKRLAAAGTRTIDYGHLTSISTVLMQQLLQSVEQAVAAGQKAFDNYNPAPIMNLVATLKNFVAISAKLDSIVLRLTNTLGIPSEKDILTFLKGSFDDIEVGKINFVSRARDRVISEGSISRTFTDEAGVEVEVHAIAESLVFNRKIKGNITQAIMRLLVDYLESDMLSALTSSEILEMLLREQGSDSFIDSTIKTIFQGPETVKKSGNKAKRTKSKKALKPRKKNRGKAPSTKVRGQSKKKLTEANTSVTVVLNAEGPVGTGSKEINLVEPAPLLMRLNSIITQKVQEQMNSSTLENRTGRFANSVEITSIVGDTILFHYMRSPYDVFSQDRGRAPWNSRLKRDPSYIINLAIREGLLDLGELPAYKTRRV